jgi:hypothetical protein
MGRDPEPRTRVAKPPRPRALRTRPFRHRTRPRLCPPRTRGRGRGPGPQGRGLCTRSSSATAPPPTRAAISGYPIRQPPWAIPSSSGWPTTAVAGPRRCTGSQRAAIIWSRRLCPPICGPPFRTSRSPRTVTTLPTCGSRAIRPGGGRPPLAERRGGPGDRVDQSPDQGRHDRGGGLVRERPVRVLHHAG